MKKKNIILIAVCACFMLFLSAGTLLKPDVDFSENENRYLASKPELSAENILSGKFEDDTEEYLNDQIIGRETWISIKGTCEKLLGIRDINGTYVCSDGRLVQKITDEEFGWKQYEKNLKQIRLMEEYLDDCDTEVYTMLVPTAAYIYSEDLPKNAMTFDEDKAMKMAADASSEFIDIRKELSAAKLEAPEKGVFYYTDHHWNGFGTFIGYKAFAEAAGISCPEYYEDIAPVELCTDFRGTLYSKVLMNGKLTDTIEAPGYALRDDIRVKMDGKKSNSVILRDRLEVKDKYTVFFGGNYGKVDIEIEDNEGKGSLLVIKDSYANSFVPYLLNDFEEITMVDTRYFRGNVSELAEDYDKVLILYSINNFAAEKILLTSSVLG